MKALYFDFSAGAAGDMICAALLDAGGDRNELLRMVKSLGLGSEEGNVEIEIEKRTTSSIAALGFRVHHPEQHAHRHLSDVLAIIERAALSAGARRRATAIFQRLAEAEAEVHGISVEQVHFHEVGAIDSIVDILGAALLLDAFAPEQIFASPVRTGHGTVQCAHGLMPVPAPATALLLRGVPTFAGDFAAEQCTPTGAAILSASVDHFGPMPTFITDRVGHGAGTRETPFPNLVRVFAGRGVDFTGRGVDAGAAQTTFVSARPALAGTEETLLVEVEAHLDNDDGEAIGHLKQRLLAGAALDVVVTAVQAKKDRPGFLVRALGPQNSEQDLLQIFFCHSSTLGARVRTERRVHLRREAVSVQLPYGTVRAKRTNFAGQIRLRAEHEDLERLAHEAGVPLQEIRQAFAAASLTVDGDA